MKFRADGSILRSIGPGERPSQKIMASSGTRIAYSRGVRSVSDSFYDLFSEP